MKNIPTVFKKLQGSQEIPLAGDISDFLFSVENRLSDLGKLKISRMDLEQLVEVLGVIVERFGGSCRLESETVFTVDITDEDLINNGKAQMWFLQDPLDFVEHDTMDIKITKIG